VSGDDDLDFTRPLGPPPPPKPEVVASARKEATLGTPQLAKRGFYVAMIQGVRLLANLTP
jgi:hypothetical protein